MKPPRSILFTKILLLLVLGTATISTNAEVEPIASTSAMPSLEEESNLNNDFAIIMEPDFVLEDDPTPPDECSDDNQKKSGYGSLVCWLWKLKLDIPDEKFKKGLLSVSIKDMVCSSFKIESIDSTYSPSQTNGKTNPAISIAVAGISAQCKGRYRSGLTSGGVIITLTSTPDKPFYVETTITSSTIQTMKEEEHTNFNDGHSPIVIPSAGNVTACQAELEVPKDHGIIFTGSISAKLLDLFAKSIASHVTSAIATTVCPQMKLALDPMLTETMQKADEIIEDLIDNDDTVVTNGVTTLDDSDTIENDTDSSFLTWDSDLKPLWYMLTSTNEFIQDHMNMGVILKFLEKMGFNHHGENDDTCEDCGYFFRGLNGLSKYLTHGTGQITIDLNKTSTTTGQSHAPEIKFVMPGIGSVTLRTFTVMVDGIDTLTNLRLLSPMEEHTLSSLLSSEEGVDVYTEIGLIVEPVEGGIIQGDPLTETFSLKVNTSDFRFGTDLDVSYLREKFHNISLGNIFNIGDNSTRKPSLMCLVSGLDNVTIPQLLAQVHMDSISIRNLETSSQGDEGETENLEDDVDMLINNVLSLLFSEYGDMVTRTIAAGTQRKIRPAINTLLTQLINDHIKPKNGTCAFEPDDSNNFYRFNESSLCSEVDKVVSRSVPQINDFTSCVSSFIQNKELVSPLDPGNTVGNPKLLLHDLKVENIGRLTSLDVLKPDGDYQVGWAIKSGECTRVNDTIVPCDQLRTNIIVELQDPNIELDLKLNLSLAFGNIATEGGAQILYDINELSMFKLHEILDRPFLLKNPLSGLSLYGLTSSINSMDILAGLEYSYGGDNGNFSSKSLSPNKVGDLATSGLTTSLLLLEDGFNSLSQIIVGSSSKQGAVQINENVGVEKHTWIATLIIIFVVANLFIVCLYKQHQWDSSNPQKQIRQLPIEFPNSLLFHKRVTNVQRMLVPFIISGTILAFIVSNFSTGASVDIDYTPASGGKSFTLPDIFTFSLGETVSQMYQARVYTLMTLVLVFSGIWPYVKLLLMLTSFITPEQFLPLARRENVLIWLDALGKYSLVDSFVLVLMLVSFRFHFDIPGVGAIDSFVTPRFGFYSFMFSTVMSLIIGHGVTFLHRLTAMPENVISTGGRESILSHRYKTKGTKGNWVQFSWVFHLLWSLATLLSIYLLVTGIQAKCFVFEFKGLAGWMLGEKSISKHSIASLGASLPNSVKDPSAFGIQCIRWTYYFFALIMPFTCIGVIILLFYVPLSLRMQHFVHTFAEICNAWSAIEVFLISTLAALLELSQFAAFMVGDNCDFMKQGVFKEVFDGALEGDDTCFDVKSSLGAGSGYLFIGVSLHCAIVWFSLRLSHHALEERIQNNDRYHSTGEDTISTAITRIYQFHLQGFLLRECEENNECHHEELDSPRRPLLDSNVQ